MAKATYRMVHLTHISKGVRHHYDGEVWQQGADTAARVEAEGLKRSEKQKAAN